MKEWYWLFDFGGTNLRLALTRGKNIDASMVVPTPSTYLKALAAIKEAASLLKQSNQVKRIKRGVGGVAGKLNPLGEKLLLAPNLHTWVGKPLSRDLSRILQAPVTLYNDAQLGAVAEAVKGSGKGQITVGYLTIGTGIGGAKVVDGMFEVGQGFEPGKVIVQGSVSLEQQISGAALKQRLGREAVLIEDKSVWAEVENKFSRLLVAATVFWNPDVIVIGGGLSSRLSIRQLKINLKHHLPDYPNLPKIARAALGENNGLQGAIIVLRD